MVFKMEAAEEVYSVQLGLSLVATVANPTATGKNTFRFIVFDEKVLKMRIMVEVYGYISRNETILVFLL
jgi:hypothetical protein